MESRSAAYRPEVRDATEDAARAELALHDTYIALVSGAFVRDLSEWSDWTTVRVRMMPSETKLGMVEIEVRSV